jgi:hypothetical protein
MPSLARDMRGLSYRKRVRGRIPANRIYKEPHRFNSMIDIAYVIVAAMYLLVGILGYIMYVKQRNPSPRIFCLLPGRTNV